MKCPTCFVMLQEPRTLVCVGTCDSKVNDYASSVRGHQWTMKPSFKLPGQVSTTQTPGAPCPTCEIESNQEVCGSCFGDIPGGWREAVVTCIAMAGARQTGKSLMLAVAKEQLDLLLERFYGTSLTGMAGTDDFFRRNYSQPLYEQRNMLQATASIADKDTTVRVPLIFHFRERNAATGGARDRVLVIRDVAGEDLEKRGGMDHMLTFFKRADAVIALLDPLSVQSVRDRLMEVIGADNEVGEPGVPIIEHVLRLLNDGSIGQRSPIPVAVALSKVDTLQQLKNSPDQHWGPIMSRAGSPLQRDPSLNGVAFDEVEGRLLHEEVKGLLAELNAGTLTAKLEDSVDTYQYFAVSALGAHPKGEVVSAGGIAPFRVLDPFKWALDITGRTA